MGRATRASPADTPRYAISSASADDDGSEIRNRWLRPCRALAIAGNAEASGSPLPGQVTRLTHAPTLPRARHAPRSAEGRFQVSARRINQRFNCIFNCNSFADLNHYIYASSSPKISHTLRDDAKYVHDFNYLQLGFLRVANLWIRFVDNLWTKNHHCSRRFLLSAETRSGKTQSRSSRHVSPRFFECGKPFVVGESHFRREARGSHAGHQLQASARGS